MTSLRAKLALGFGGLLAILLAVSLLSVIVLNSYSHTLERFFRENYNSAIYCDRMKDALDALDSRAQGIVWGDAEITQKIAEAAQMRQFQSNLDLQLANCTLPGELELSRRLDALWQNYRRAYQQFDAADGNSRDLYRSTLLPQYQSARSVAQQVADMNMSNMVSVDGQVKRTLAGVKRALLILVFIGVLLAATLVGTVGATILRPLRTLTLSAGQIASGNLDLHMPVRSRDEVGRLTEAFNSMASRLREFKQLDSERLLRTQQTTQLAIDSLHDAVVVIGPDGKIEISNTAAQLHFKIAPGASIAQLGLRWLSTIFAQVSTTGQAFEPEEYTAAIQLFEEGREKFLLPRAVPMLDPKGKTIGVAVILVDVTQLRHADELKSGLVSTVSHELRTPLTALRMAVSLLAGEKVGQLTPRQRTLVKAAGEESERLFQIIENLLNISRIESGRAQFEFRRLAPSEILRAVVEPMQTAFEQKGVRLQMTCAPDLPQLEVDATFIGHALGNLVSNALKFTPAGGSVTVAAENHDGQVAFVVEDTGVGIPPQHAPRVFEKFFRIPRADGPSGVGLGLAIAKEIVEAHGGRIHFRSRDGGGSVFHFTLPSMPPEPERPQTEREGAVPAVPERFLSGTRGSAGASPSRQRPII
ncbi:MAG TPA: ATP-binding protein [Tepidisphaeraceae bacterium]|nr:ATP-binding protein [Tepidisphaeraceae bacterium]